MTLGGKIEDKSSVTGPDESEVRAEATRLQVGSSWGVCWDWGQDLCLKEHAGLLPEASGSEACARFRRGWACTLPGTSRSTPWSSSTSGPSSGTRSPTGRRSSTSPRWALVLLSLWAPGAWAGCDPGNHAWIVSYFPWVFRRHYRLRGRNGISEPGITGDLPGVASVQGEGCSRPGHRQVLSTFSFRTEACTCSAWTVTTWSTPRSREDLPGEAGARVGGPSVTARVFTLHSSRTLSPWLSGLRGRDHTASGGRQSSRTKTKAVLTLCSSYTPVAQPGMLLSISTDFDFISLKFQGIRKKRTTSEYKIPPNIVPCQERYSKYIN